MKSLSIVIPAYNEESRLPATLETAFRYLDSKHFTFLEVLVVDDGSRDGTAALVKSVTTQYPHLRLLRNPGNRGKGFAIRNGMREAQGDWVLFSDADLSTPIEELDKLIDAVERANADGAIGSRALNRKLVGKRQSIFREFSGRIFNFAMRLVTGLAYMDTQCGFKLFRREAARCVSSRQLIEGFGFDVEILYIARKHGFRILEIPVRWFNVEGTKVSLWNGIAAFVDPLQVRWHDLMGRYK